MVLDELVREETRQEEMGRERQKKKKKARKEARARRNRRERECVLKRLDTHTRSHEKKIFARAKL